MITRRSDFVKESVKKSAALIFGTGKPQNPKNYSYFSEIRIFDHAAGGISKSSFPVFQGVYPCEGYIYPSQGYIYPSQGYTVYS